MRPRDNPFRAERTDALASRLLGTTWEKLLADLERLDYRAAIVGPHGSGKTTLLEELGRRLERRGLQTACLRVDGRRPGSVLSQTKRAGGSVVVLLDGADLLGPLAWAFLRARRRRRGLIITSHKPGRLPTLVRCSTSAELLRELVGELAPKWAPRLAPAADRLFHTSGGNIRKAFRAFYRAFAEGEPSAAEQAMEV